MRGIILSGGLGTRMYPTTKVVGKQLLHVYDKPAIYYPLSTLALANIKDIAIISTQKDIPLVEKLLGDGKKFGLKITYFIQNEPRGTAEAFLIAEDFIDNASVSLILGDNFFYGDGLPQKLKTWANHCDGARVLAYPVKNPSAFGVLEINTQGEPIRLIEKPTEPKSHWAVTGFYFYDKTVVEKAKQLKPSARGELEITDLNNLYLKEKKLKVSLLSRGVAWLDMGTPDSLLSCAQFVQTIEKQQGFKISCLEEIVYQRGFIDKKQLGDLIKEIPPSDYSKYLSNVLRGTRY